MNNDVQCLQLEVENEVGVKLNVSWSVVEKSRSEVKIEPEIFWLRTVITGRITCKVTQIKIRQEGGTTPTLGTH